MIRRETDIHWHCDHRNCRKEFTLSRNQAARYRKAENDGTLGDTFFYCSNSCRGFDGDLKLKQARQPQADSLLERIEAYWESVKDPAYYTELRYNYASPLSYRDKRSKVVRSQTGQPSIMQDRLI
jgi:hypothetical protein